MAARISRTCWTRGAGGLAILGRVTTKARSTPRWLLVVPFLLVFAGVIIGGHFYIAQRLIFDPELPATWTRLGAWTIAGLCGALVLQPIAERRFPASWARIIAWPASLWMGFAFLFLMALLLSDALLGVLGFFSDSFTKVSGARLQAIIVSAVVLVAGLLALRFGLAFPAVRRMEVSLRKWPRGFDGFRIVQISDIHIGPLLDRRFSERLVARVNSLDPDLVAVTGDLVDGSVEKLSGEVEPFAGLRGRHGVFFVTGNHDFYSGAEAWVEHVKKLGMRVLRNEHVVLRKGPDAFALVGVDDHRANLMPGEGGEDLDAALEGIDSNLARILLAHDPSTFKRACQMCVDLQLSGHTHGGQIWPFGWLVRLAIPFVDGLHRRGNATLYVSRGTGFWGPPMRLGAPSEITEITLRAPDGTA